MPFIVLDPGAAEAAPVTTLGEPLTSEGETLASMEDWLTAALGGRDDLSSARKRGWINDAYIDICTSNDLDELHGSISITTVAGQPLYLLAPVVSTIQGAALVDSLLPSGGIPLTKIDKGYYRTLEDDEDRPQFFFREGNMMVVYPTPDKAYTIPIDFRITPLPLVEDTDSPILRLEWHRAIRLTARQMAFDDLQQFDKLPQAENSAVQTVRRRNNREASEDEGRVVRSSVPGRERRSTAWRGDRY